MIYTHARLHSHSRILTTALSTEVLISTAAAPTGPMSVPSCCMAAAGSPSSSSSSSHQGGQDCLLKVADGARTPPLQRAAGAYGKPMLHYDMDHFILDLLHLAELGIPKTPWKHGILNNASDDARDRIDEKLRGWKHPLDCRRKDDNRSRAQNWFTGEAWASFCAGQRGSQGGPKTIAEIVLVIADDMQQRGVTHGSGTVVARNARYN